MEARMLGRDVEEEEEATPWKEQENWEAEQIKKAAMRKAKKGRGDEYELVMEDQIDFIMDRALSGDLEACCQLLGKHLTYLGCGAWEPRLPNVDKASNCIPRPVPCAMLGVLEVQLPEALHLD